MCALALTALTASVLLRELGWRGVGVISVCVAVISAGTILPKLSAIVDVMGGFSAETGVSDVSKTVLKIVGIGYLSGLVSEVCRDMGEGSIASSVLTVGRMEMLFVAAPSFFEVIRLGLELME